MKSETLEHSLFSQAKSGPYQLLEYENSELYEIPVNSNTLSFETSSLQSKYLRNLYCEKNGDLSSDFKMNLINFYVFVIGFSVFSVGVNSFVYAEGGITKTHFTVHLLSILVLDLVSCLCLLIIAFADSYRLRARFIYSVLSVLILSYFIIGDDRVLSGITGEKYKEPTIPSGLLILGLLYLMRQVLFDSSYIVLLLAIGSSIGFLIAQVVFSPNSLYSTLAEFFILLLLCVLHSIDSYLVDYRTKQLFIRKIKDRENIRRTSIKRPEFPAHDNIYITTNYDIIMETFEVVKTRLKSTAKVMVYKEIKFVLKQIQNDMDYVLSVISKGLGKSKASGAFESGIDVEDTLYLKEFCEEDITVVQSTPKERLFQTALPQLQFQETSFSPDNALSLIGVDWQFNIFEIHDILKCSVSAIAKHMYKKCSFVECLDIPVAIYNNFFEELEKHYQNIAYHNSCHAADTVHNCMYILNTSRYLEKINVLESFSVVLAGLSHDVGHPGLTNRFLLNSMDNLCIQYNDRSILENMHAATVFSIMKDSKFNILAKLSQTDFAGIRKLTIALILSTDFLKHFEVIAKFKIKSLYLNNLNMENTEDRRLFLKMIMKAGDLGYTAKTISLHEQWSRLLCDELISQAELEKSMNLDSVTDYNRDTFSVPKFQIGFIKYIALPLFEPLSQYLASPEIKVFVMGQIKKNMKYWEALIESSEIGKKQDSMSSEDSRLMS